MGTELVKAPGAELAQQQATDINGLMTLALTSKEVTPEKLAALFDLKERVDARDAERQFNIDFAAAKAEMPVLTKDGKKVMVRDGVDKGSIPFATYNNVNDTIGPIERKYGFTRVFLQKPCLQKEGVIMVLRLIHRSGHQIESERYMPPDPGPGRNGAQAIGSGESYARRYMTLGLWDLVAQNADDDGATAESITRDQADNINGLISEIGMDTKRKQKFLELAHANSVSKIQRNQYEMCIIFLEQARRAVAK